MMKRAFPTIAGSALVAAALVVTVVTTALSAEIASLKTTSGSVKKQVHRLAVQVNVNDPAMMNLALNNVTNVAQYYAEAGGQVDIEVIAFGPGLHMLRDDTSPVKSRIKSMSETMPRLKFSACGNTRDNMTKVEAREIPLVSEAKIVKAGVVRIMELQEQGWSYLRP